MTPVANVPPIVKLIAFLVVLGAGYQLWPELLWAVLGVVLLYLVLAHGDKVGSIFEQGSNGLTALIAPPNPGPR